MLEFVIMGKRDEVFDEIAFMARLERATGLALFRYQVRLNPNSVN
uniref:Uncharacterized protein n=1 Tax=viral metagenome TaxID=1070528 RepID=A0A6M3IQH6_9ZZZZ